MTTPTVLITGALTGIGRATALAFAHEGANVVVSGRREEAGRQLAAELRALGVKAEFLRADVTDEAQVQSLVSQTVERFGRLDVAVNNAGVEGELGPLAGQTAANYHATPEEIAQTIVFLASDKARFLTGQRIAVDGGYTAQ